jgi:hypothetical protein
LDCLANIGKLVDILCDFEHPSSNDQVLADTSRRLIVVFETIYERPITVHEFLKWAPRLRDASTASMSATLRESMEHFNTAMNTVDRIHKQYLGAIDDRYLMIGKYINRIDHSSCYEEIINNILEDQYQGKQGVYESCMKTLITKIYQNTYDNEPRPTDVHYFFHHAKTQKLHLESGELHGVITDKKTETDRFITSMQAVFQNVICRDPDHLEIVEYLIYYRNDVEKEIFDVNLSDEKVANELYASLEFNDVLRNEIQRQFLEITKKPPLPSLIYKCMQQILLSEDTKRNYKPFIKDYITNLELQ